jgi:hypothetical protein
VDEPPLDITVVVTDRVVFPPPLPTMMATIAPAIAPATAGRRIFRFICDGLLSEAVLVRLDLS